MMEYITVTGCIVGAWALLLILSGERFSRIGALVQDAAEKAAETETARQNATL